MSTHLTADVLAAATEGGLSPEQAAEIDRHVASCSDCSASLADTVAALDTVRHALADLSVPDHATMPAAVHAWLDAAVAAESARRASGEAAVELARMQAEHAKRLTTGSFGENSPTKRHTGIPEGVDNVTLQRERIGS